MSELTRRQVLSGGAAVAAAAAVTVVPEASAGTLTFPPGFAWGAATAAYQVEGAPLADGKGQSTWDVFAHTPGKTYKGQTGDVADDHYHRWRDDVALMASLRLTSYRFSISWPRVLPTGGGTVNQKGLDFYKALVDALLAHGIRPMVTLFHWDTPQALERNGGWRNRDTAYRFADYARLVGRALGNKVCYLTLNEPSNVAISGYRSGATAPGVKDWSGASRVIHHLMLGHGLAVRALRESGVTRDVGIALPIIPCYPNDSTRAAASCARQWDGYQNRMYFDPIFRGSYPSDVPSGMLDGTALRAAVRPGDLDIVRTPISLVGVNYYGVRYQDGTGRAVFRHRDPIAAWIDVNPVGLYDALTRIKRDYGNPRICITENGKPTATPRGADGAFHDRDRIAYCEAHLRQLHRALQAGVRVTGYHMWSLMDNFEWQLGYSHRYGMVYVDYATLQRHVKESGYWYRAVIARNGL